MSTLILSQLVATRRSEPSPPDRRSSDSASDPAGQLQVAKAFGARVNGSSLPVLEDQVLIRLAKWICTDTAGSGNGHELIQTYCAFNSDGRHRRSNSPALEPAVEVIDDPAGAVQPESSARAPLEDAS